MYPILRNLIKTLNRHDVIAAVDENDLTSDAFAQVAEKVQGCAGGFFLSVFPLERSDFVNALDECSEARHAATGDRVDWTRRDGVDPDSAITEFIGEISYRSLKGGLAKTHDLVVIHHPG